MNCDRVFMVLTRGPFPSGDADDLAVEEHLLSCQSCRRLALALQPAIELFEEAASLDEKDELPTYWGRLISASPGEHFEDHADEIELTFKSPRPESTRYGRSRAPVHAGRERTDGRSRWPLAGAFLIGIIFCLTTLEWMTGGSDANARTRLLPAAEGTDAAWTPPAKTASMPSLAGLLICPREEQPRDANSAAPVSATAPKAKVVATANSQAAACCTECHKAGDRSDLDHKAMSQVVMACQGCHH